MKRKDNFSYQILLWLTSHPWLKLISLIIAILSWFYVRGEINRFNY